jgi:hypothetical protein
MVGRFILAVKSDIHLPVTGFGIIFILHHSARELSFDWHYKNDKLLAQILESEIEYIAQAILSKLGSRGRLGSLGSHRFLGLV